MMRRSLSFWESVPLPIELYLGFLRRLAPIDKDYGRWRPKDWKLFADVPGIFQFGGRYCVSPSVWCATIRIWESRRFDHGSTMNRA